MRLQASGRDGTCRLSVYRLGQGENRTHWVAPLALDPATASRQSPPLAALADSRLSPQQQAVREALEEKYPDLATIYQGAVLVLRQDNNPERFVHAAHSLRELMEKFPRVARVEQQAHGETLTQEVIRIRTLWQSATNRSTCHGEDGWAGTIDGPLSKLLEGVDRLIAWFDGHKPRRDEEAQRFLQTVEASGRALPAPLARLNTRYWMELREYFQGVAHHRGSSPDEFAQYVEALERLLLDLLHPRTFGDFDAIDQLVEAGESTDA